MSPLSNPIDTPDRGNLKIQLISKVDSLPIPDAVVQISYTGIPGNILEELRTDQSGQTETIELPTPPLEYSLDILLLILNRLPLPELNFFQELLHYRTFQ